MRMRIPAACAVAGFAAGGLIFAASRRHGQQKLDKQLREHLSEGQIDKMLMDSFPASDPPSTY